MRLSDKLQFVAQSDKLKHVGHPIPKYGWQPISIRVRYLQEEEHTG